MEPARRRERIELTSPGERGWWLRTRSPDDAVSVVFCRESQSTAYADANSSGTLGPFRGLLVAHEGKMAVVQVFLSGVVGGHLVDIDTADGESRVIDPVSAQLDSALGTIAPGYFAVAATQSAEED